jgi:hypothetical protein
MTTTSDASHTPDDDPRFGRLRRLNIIAAIFHGASAAAMLALANNFVIPITGSFMEGPPGQQATWPSSVIAEPQFSVITASFLILSALAHALISLPGIYERYVAALQQGRAPYRWLEYTISSSVMLVPIAMLTGIMDVAALIAIVGANMSMIWFGALQEYAPPATSPAGWRPFVYGCLAGAVPWVAISSYLIGSGSNVPVFVYGIYISLFILFNIFAIVMVAHYKGWRKFADYVHGERAYVVLSFVAKSALAWQVFAGTLAS